GRVHPGVALEGRLVSSLGSFHLTREAQAVPQGEMGLGSARIQRQGAGQGVPGPRQIPIPEPFLALFQESSGGHGVVGRLRWGEGHWYIGWAWRGRLWGGGSVPDSGERLLLAVAYRAIRDRVASDVLRICNILSFAFRVSRGTRAPGFP